MGESCALVLVSGCNICRHYCQIGNSSESRGEKKARLNWPDLESDGTIVRKGEMVPRYVKVFGRKVSAESLTSIQSPDELSYLKV